MYMLRAALTLLLTLSIGVKSQGAGQEVGNTRVTTGEFVHLMAALSEPEGYFDSDNFVSNERAYLKIFPGLQREMKMQGAYIGVGPDQNYSYIARLKPPIAFIIDIRRKNALQHLYFKSLFQLSADRIHYLERLFGRRIEIPAGGSQTLGISAFLRLVDAARPDPSFAEQMYRESIRVIQSWRVDLDKEDFESLRGIAAAFSQNGPDLKFTSFDRPPRAHHPSYRELLEETDADGVPSNFLANETDFLLLKQMHSQNRIVPVVGDLSGPDAMKRIGAELRRRNIALACLYVSNVEFYLFGRPNWKLYIGNLNLLPYGESSFIIRSYARYPAPYGGAQGSGYYMGTVCEPLPQFLSDEKSGKNSRYDDLIQGSRQR